MEKGLEHGDADPGRKRIGVARRTRLPLKKPDLFLWLNLPETTKEKEIGMKKMLLTLRFELTMGAAALNHVVCRLKRPRGSVTFFVFFWGRKRGRFSFEWGLMEN